MMILRVANQIGVEGFAFLLCKLRLGIGVVFYPHNSTFLEADLAIGIVFSEMLGVSKRDNAQG